MQTKVALIPEDIKLGKGVLLNSKTGRYCAVGFMLKNWEIVEDDMIRDDESNSDAEEQLCEILGTDQKEIDDLFGKNDNARTFKQRLQILVDFLKEHDVVVKFKRNRKKK